LSAKYPTSLGLAWGYVISLVVSRVARGGIPRAVQQRSELLLDAARHENCCVLFPRGVGQWEYADGAGGMRRLAEAPRDAMCTASEGAASASSVACNAVDKQGRWLAKLRAGDLSGLVTPESQYLRIRGEVIEGNPRTAEAYRDKCCELVGLGLTPDMQKYGHLSSPQDFDLLRWVVRRGSGCFWGP